MLLHVFEKKACKMENTDTPEEDLTQDSLTKPAKCDAVGCIGNNQAQWSLCHAKSCSKFVHHECYKRLLNRHNIAALTDPLTSNTLLVCSKTCYNRVNKTFSQQPTSRIPWDKDGREGPDDPNHSLRILLDWLLKEGNYRKFRGGTETKGMRKIDYGKSLSLQMRDAGCRVPRSADAVVKKIQELETKFVQAHDWANNTGQGVREQDGQETFENLVLQRCRWYFDLLPIMGDRSKAAPPITTDNLLESDADSGLSDSVVEESQTKRKSDASSKASTKISRKTPPNSSSKKQKKNIDDMELFAEFLSSKAESEAVHWEEIARHNKKMEELEEQKVKQEEEKTKWSAKEAELAYKTKLMKTKVELESEGFSKADILAMFPDLAPLYSSSRET